MNIIEKIEKQGYKVEIGSLGDYFIFNNKGEFVCAGNKDSIIEKFNIYKNIDTKLNIWR